MKTGKFILLRILKGLIAFVLIIAMVATIYEIHYEVTSKPEMLDLYKGIMVSKSLEGELENISLEEEKKIRAEVLLQAKTAFGLHRSRTIRVTERTYDAITLNLGGSWSPLSGRFNVRDQILKALPNTLILFTITTIISMLIAIYLGVKKAQHVNSLFDRITSMLTMFFVGIPPWITGSFLILFLVYYLEILPFGSLYSTNPPPVGMMNMFIDRVRHMLIPIIAVVLVRIWASSYQIRNILLSYLQEDYIHSARGRGLSERRVIFGHALRSAAPAITTMGLLSIIEAISGDIVLEQVLAWPGLGLLLWNAIQRHQMNTIMGVTTMLTLIFIIGLILLDSIYVLLDPRIQYS